MPSFDYSDIKYSTALLKESDTSHRTAWLVESTDLIITAGHYLVEGEYYLVKFSLLHILVSGSLFFYKILNYNKL
jgi:hypothetical protein